MSHEDFIQETIRRFRTSRSRDELHLLLISEEAWEILIEEANLSSEEEEALREGLSKLEADLYEEDKHRLQADPREREKFLSEFPQFKRELKRQIRKLHELADKVETVHKRCTVSNIVANSAGVVSGALTILGLSLAPVTAGTSLALLATGVGLGTASSITGISTNIVELSSTSYANAEASHLVSPDSDSEKAMVFAKCLSDYSGRIFFIAKNFPQALKNITKNVRAIKLAKANPRLAARAIRFMTAGQISARSSRQVQRAFGGTVLGMTRGARILGTVTAGASLLLDAHNLAKDWTHFQEGAKAESAEKLRLQAEELEKKLKFLTQIYESLK